MIYNEGDLLRLKPWQVTGFWGSYYDVRLIDEPRVVFTLPAKFVQESGVVAGKAPSMEVRLLRVIIHRKRTTRKSWIIRCINFEKQIRRLEQGHGDITDIQVWFTKKDFMWKVPYKALEL